ncbi:glycosyltransferase [Sphingomonas sp. MMS24-JH45]
MEAYKGLDTLLAANRLWQEAGVPIRLLIAGDGPELDADAEALSAPNIRLRRGRVPQDELAVLVAAAAAAVLPYHDATQSGVVASTFGAGRPVICSDVGGLAGAVGDAGLLVPPGDPIALATAGRRLIEEPGLLDALAGRRAPAPPARSGGTTSRGARR